MHFNSLAKAALVGSMALEAAAGPVQAASPAAPKDERAVHANVHVPTYSLADVKFKDHDAKDKRAVHANANIPTYSLADIKFKDPDAKDKRAVHANVNVPTYSLADVKFKDPDAKDKRGVHAGIDANVPTYSLADIKFKDHEEKDKRAIHADANVPTYSLADIKFKDHDEKAKRGVHADVNVPTYSLADIKFKDHDAKEKRGVHADVNVPTYSLADIKFKDHDEKDKRGVHAGVDANVPTYSLADIKFKDPDAKEKRGVHADVNIPTFSLANIKFKDHDEKDKRGVHAEANVPTYSLADIKFKDPEAEKRAIHAGVDVPTYSLADIKFKDPEAEKRAIHAGVDVPTYSLADIKFKDPEAEKRAIHAGVDVPTYSLADIKFKDPAAEKRAIHAGVDVPTYSLADIKFKDPEAEKRAIHAGVDVDVPTYSLADIKFKDPEAEKRAIHAGVDVPTYSLADIKFKDPHAEKRAIHAGVDVDVPTYSLADIKFKDPEAEKRAIHAGVDVPTYSLADIKFKDPEAEKRAIHAGVDVPTYSLADIKFKDPESEKRAVHAGVDVPTYSLADIKFKDPEAEKRGVHAGVDVPTYSLADIKFKDHDAKDKRAVPATHTVHERQPAPLARRWKRTARVPADAVLPMRIGLKGRNLDAGHDLLMDIADPASANFAKHMSAKEVIDFFAPDRSTVEAVVAWVTASGIDIDRVSLSANKQWLQFDASTAEAEQLLLTEFHAYEHHEHGTRDIAAAHYHVPRAVQPHIDYITPGIRLRHDDGAANKAAKVAKRAADAKAKRDAAAPKTPKDRRAFRAQFTDPTRVDTDGVTLGKTPPAFNSSTCYKYVTPACIRAQYGIPTGTTAAAGNELGVFESLAQHYSKADLDAYFAAVAPEVQGTYPANRLVDGATADTTPALAGTEAELDFQAAMPLIYPQGAVLFQVDDERIQANQTVTGTPYQGFWNTFFDAIDGSYCTASAYGETGNCVKPECLDPSYPDNAATGGYAGALQCGVYEPTNVISISYGSGEEDLPAYYWRRQCDEILKLGLQGVTVVISSGDYGVGQWAGEGGNADGCAGANGQIFYPSSQATCPYVLAVGATELGLTTPATTATTTTTTNASNCSASAAPTLTERATTRFSSGGGFSNYFDRPSYQRGVVDAYLSAASLPFGGYSDMGNRNFSGVGTGVYRTTGRGYPDVSAVGDYFLSVLNGEWSIIGGTSLSAPVWASVLTLINEARLAQGKATVGFVNPTLYAHPEVFNDVVAGSNPGCMTDGFPAAQGWDPVTGLGSPNFPKLMALFKSLQ